MSLADKLATLRSRCWHATANALEFFGPVADSVKGELSKAERVRAISKAAVAGAATKGALLATLKAPDTLVDVVVPLTMALLTGVLDAVSRYHQGVERPTEATEQCPSSPPTPPDLSPSSSPQPPSSAS